MRILLSHLLTLLLSFLYFFSPSVEFLMNIYCKGKDSKPSNLATHTEAVRLMPPAARLAEVCFYHAYTDSRVLY